MKALPAGIDHALLPEGLRDLVRVLGEDRAFRFVEKRGGGRLIVPIRVTPDHPLIEDLGAEGFVMLVQQLGRMVLDLPKYDAVLRQLRHRRVRQLRRKGLSQSEVAVMAGYTRRHVINILGAEPIDDRQQDLFGKLPDDAPESYAGQANDPFGLAGKRP